MATRDLINCVHFGPADAMCAAKRYVEPSTGVCGTVCDGREPVDSSRGLVIGTVEITVDGKRLIEREGPLLWAELHARPWSRAATPAAERAWLKAFGDRLPCGECREHYAAWMSLIVDPDLIYSGRYFAATWSLHDSVNARLGKPRLGQVEARELWQPKG